ncbi:MAG: efflux RND transporter periplasmic adaptor subunit [Clostridiaceae bacterium]|nr:efflux RND transporter periplasmic adaptor subunit [Clostridiaceae bacterium]
MRSKRFYMVIIILLVGITMVGCTGSAEEAIVEEQEVYVPVEVEEVEVKTIANSITLNGRVHANDEAMVLPKIPGRVTNVNVRLGDYVTKDSVLFVIDQTDIRKNVEQAQQAVNAAQKGVEQAESSIGAARINYDTVKDNIENAQANLERTRELYEAGAASKSQLEQAELSASTRSLDAAESQIRQAEIGHQQALNQLSQAEISYRQAQDALEDTIVRAPISGIISSLNVVAGEMSSGAQPLAIISDINTVYLQANVTENIVNILNQGQEVAINISAALEEEIVGKIDFISPTIDPNTQQYKVKVYINNAERKIRTGMSGSVTLDTDSRGDILAINSRAVLDKDGEKIVYVVEGDYAVEIVVTVGMDTGSEIEIIEGLQEGDKVIVKGQQYVVDGETVKVVGGE